MVIQQAGDALFSTTDNSFMSDDEDDEYDDYDDSENALGHISDTNRFDIADIIRRPIDDFEEASPTPHVTELDPRDVVIQQEKDALLAAPDSSFMSDDEDDEDDEHLLVDSNDTDVPSHIIRRPIDDVDQPDNTTINIEMDPRDVVIQQAGDAQFAGANNSFMSDDEDDEDAYDDINNDRIDSNKTDRLNSTNITRRPINNSFMSDDEVNATDDDGDKYSVDGDKGSTEHLDNDNLMRRLINEVDEARKIEMDPIDAMVQEERDALFARDDNSVMSDSRDDDSDVNGDKYHVDSESDSPIRLDSVDVIRRPINGIYQTSKNVIQQAGKDRKSVV